MLDSAYTPSSLRRTLRRSDFKSHKSLRKGDTLLHVLHMASDRANGQDPIPFVIEKSRRRGKPVFILKEIVDQLLLRKASAELNRKITSPSFSRELLIPSIRSLLKEAPPFRIYRFDIRSFYESFDTLAVKKKLRFALAETPAVRNVIESFLDSTAARGCTGLPRGVGISQSIADYMLMPLDDHFLFRQDVFFYGRYIDDIVILSESRLTRKIVIERILEHLPAGMSLNQKKGKKKAIEVPRTEKSIGTSSSKGGSTFSYLGYQFYVSNHGVLGKNSFRTVTLDIADSKVLKIKTKIARSIIAYINNGDSQLLEDRFRFLTSNYSLPEKDKRHKRLGGIFYNYHFIDEDQSRALLDLDAFLKRALLAGKSGVFRKFHASSSAALRRKLLKYSFLDGFRSRRILHFSPSRIKTIGACWADI